jgi:hypothetical protein
LAGNLLESTTLRVPSQTSTATQANQVHSINDKIPRSVHSVINNRTSKYTFRTHKLQLYFKTSHNYIKKGEHIYLINPFETCMPKTDGCFLPPPQQRKERLTLEVMLDGFGKPGSWLPVSAKTVEVVAFAPIARWPVDWFASPAA